jgi:uncharacterized protein
MTSMYKRLVIAVVFLATVCASVATASTPQPPDAPRDYVVDLAGIVRSDLKDELNTYLQTLEQKTTAQVLVLTVQTLDNQNIEEFALNTKEKWKLGQKGKDNGVLIVVAMKDRKYRIEVGYGLESVLPDSLVGSIGREYFVPYFKQGDYSTGIYSGTIAVIRTIATHEGVSITNGSERTQPRGDYSRKPLSAFNKIVLAVFGIIVLLLFITHPRQFLLLLLAFSMGGGRGGWSGGGGGGFGGGGSFGGGGGGSGGGGGASGGW